MAAPIAPHPAALAQAIDPSILHGIQRASQATATDFGLLMAQAAQESGFHADAKSATSSAAGLYQFTDSTWLDMVRRFGAKYGAGQWAQQIGQDGAGKAIVSDLATRQKILALRQDPGLSAALAGEYTKLNQAEVQQALGHPLRRADLYMAHFLGASGASTFLKAVETKGDVAAADLLPEAAAANKGIFFDAQTGKARSVADIYHSLAGKIEKMAADLSGFAASGANPVPAQGVHGDATPSPATSDIGATSSLGHALNWSADQVSGAILSLLNIVALAALKLSGSESSAPDAVLAPDPAKERRSI